MTSHLFTLILLSFVYSSSFSQESPNSGYFPFKMDDIYEKAAIAEFFKSDPNFDRESFSLMPIIFFNQLHYDFEIPSKDKMTEMIKQFQKDLGNQQTGKLNTNEAKELLNRSSVIQSKTVNVIDDRITLEIYPYYVHAKGTWKLINNQHGAPINIADINCFKDKRICMMSFAFLSDVLSDFSGSYSLAMYNFQYDIVSWDRSEIVATNTLPCKIQKLNINLNQKEVFQFDTYNDSGSCSDIGKKIFDEDEYPMISKLVPGFPESLNYWEKQKEKQADYFSSNMKKIFSIIMSLKK